MIASPALAALYGALYGALSGWLSRLALKRVINSSDTVFYSVFVGGIFARLGLLAGAICLLRHERYIIIILFAACMIIVQMFFEVFPIRHGTKRNS